ncbi:MAG TPA: class I SAM-dependent methyltransferase [Gemmatimonadaceae bacterium]|nr:class I SAM-dependent methyltransferase [Gemmatimonadaceae bacterium]
MTPAILTAFLVLAALTAWAGYYALKTKAERHQRGLFRAWPIRTVSLQELDPVFEPGPFGPTLETEVLFVGRGNIHVPGGTSDAEAWVLAVLARRAGAMFEIGTATGKTAYLWARNAPEGAVIMTMTLAPDQLSSYTKERGDTRKDVRRAHEESAFTRFLYSGTAAESRITQLFGDSKDLDVSPYLERFDLIFVDGSHAYSYVLSDSRNALRMCAPGGLILWHDYRGPGRTKGVFRGLNELAQELPLVHVAGTSFVAYRKPRG